MANLLDAYNPEMWAKESLAILTNNLVMGALVHTDFSYEFRKHGDTVHISKPGTYEAVRKNINSDVTFQVTTGESTPVLLDNHVHVSFFIKDGERFYAREDLLTYFLGPAIQAICVKVDNDLLALAPEFLANSYGYPNALDATNVQDAILGVRKIMNDNNVPVIRRNLVWCNESSQVALQDGNFSKAHSFDLENYALKEQSLGRRYGFNNYMTQNLPYDEETTGGGGGGGVTGKYDLPYFISDQSYEEDISVTATVNGNHAQGATTISVTYGSGQTVGSLRRFVTIGNATYCVYNSLQEGPGGSTSQISLEQGLLEDVSSGTDVRHYIVRGSNPTGGSFNTVDRVTVKFSGDGVNEQPYCPPVVGQQIILRGTGFAPASFTIMRVETATGGPYMGFPGDVFYDLVLDRKIPGIWTSSGAAELNPHVGLLMGGVSCIQEVPNAIGYFGSSYSSGTAAGTSLTLSSTPVTNIGFVRIGNRTYNITDSTDNGSLILTIKLDEELAQSVASGDPIWIYSTPMNTLSEISAVGATAINVGTESNFVPLIGQRFRSSVGTPVYTIQRVVYASASPPSFTYTLHLDRPLEEEIADDRPLSFDPIVRTKTLISADQTFEMVQGLFLETTAPAASDGNYSVEIPVIGYSPLQGRGWIECGGTAHPIENLQPNSFPVTSLVTILNFTCRNRMPLRFIPRNETCGPGSSDELPVFGSNVPVVGQQFIVQEDEYVYRVTEIAAGVVTLTTELDVGTLQYEVSEDAILALNPYGIGTSGGSEEVTTTTRYNLAFVRNAIALVSRPLSPPLAGTADSSIASSDKLSIRCTIKYDATAQGHLVTLDLLYGVKVLDVDLGAVLLG